MAALTLSTTVSPMTGGVAAQAGQGQDTLFTVGGTWATGDTISIVFTDSLSAVQTLVGKGNLTGVQPTFCFTYKQRVHLLAGSNWVFSAVGEPTMFNDISGTLGNGFVNLTDFYNATVNAVALTNYQGNIAVLSTDNIQTWFVDPDPTQFAQLQVLENIGTFAAQSVQALGDLDVLFLHYTGVRSLRVRDSSNNAIVVDIGSAIDSLIQEKLLASTLTQQAAACGIVEPSSNRYWLFLLDTVYVLSYFPTNKIVAWSTYQPTYNNAGVQTAFVPQKFIIYNGQVLCRASDAVYTYGGSDNNTYDTCVKSWATSYLDFKAPGKMKNTQTLGVACEGNWVLSLSTDPISGKSETAYTSDGSSYDIGSVTFQRTGSHIQFLAQTSDASAVVFSGLNLQYDLGAKR